MAVSGHALAVVEFQQVVDWIAGRAFSEPGKVALRALRPSGDAHWIRAELGRVEDTRVLLASARPWTPPVIPEISQALGRLPVEGGSLDPAELHGVGLLLGSARVIADLLDRHGSELARLVSLRERLYTHPELQKQLERSVDAQGDVLDSASPALRDIRSRLRKAQRTLVGKLETFMHNLPDRIRVADGSVTLRDGRYVVPVRREGKSEVGGVVHDESATGGTLFVEPPVALGLMNELRGFEAEEAREIHRILLALTSSCRPHAPEFERSYRGMIAFDSLYARARVATEWDATCPEVTEAERGRFHIAGGRHPLLLARAEVQVIPFDLSLEPDERVLVVSGPNTGGKSVFLKAVGLITSLTQAGVVPPVGPGTKLPVFRTFYADIGDEQSIAADLSTFSAHLLNLKEIVEGADAASLVLIDEMGTGTDPTEGAALARAVLERLVSVGALGIVTSHLGALKRLDGPQTGIVNASLQFDPDRMEPTYRFVKGRPGRSFGLAIARLRGLPDEVLRAAEGFIDSGEASMDDLLERLERQEREAESLVASLAREASEAERLRSELEARETELREFERNAERKARDEARALLLEARSEVEEVIREVRQARDHEALESRGRRARRQVERAAEKQRKLKPKREDRAADERPFVVGDRVCVAGSGAQGIIVELRDTRAVLEVSGLRLQVSAGDLEIFRGSAAPRRSASRAHLETSPSGWEPSDDGLTEVDLRGLRVDEVEIRLGPALDRALITDVPEFRIIHGMGTGAVRERVRELLERDGRIASFRLGGRGEGGAGVTMVTFR